VDWKLKPTEVHFEGLERLVAAIDDLTAAVSANTAAANALIAAFAAGDQSAAIESQVALLDATNTAMTNAVTPPAPEPPA